MNKICTTIEQGKRLLELGLDPNTADMFWPYHEKWYSEGDEWEGYEDFPRAEPYLTYTREDKEWENPKQDIPAWSLTILLIILRDWQCIWLGANDVASWVTEFNLGSGKHYATDPTTDPLDAAYTCLVWLIENGKIDPKNITT